MIAAEFVLSAARAAQFPADGLPEIALAGRSNVGKSSLINTLVRRNKLARTSNEPGRTQTLNYYRIENSFYLVDMPGYGYAKVSHTVREQWRKLIEEYLLNRETLRMVLQVVDLRHPPSRDDIAMWEWLSHFDRPRAVVATKADKISKTKREDHLAVIRRDLGIRQEPLILFSAEDGLGRDELWQLVYQAVR